MPDIPIMHKKEHMLGNFVRLDREHLLRTLYNSNTCLDLSTCYKFLLGEQEHLLGL
jgi:hypothetical protein